MRIKYKDFMYNPLNVVKRCLSISYDPYFKCWLPLVTEFNKNDMIICSYFLEGREQEQYSEYISEADKIKFLFPYSVALPMGGTI